MFHALRLILAAASLFALGALAANPQLPWPNAAPTPSALGEDFARAVMPPVIVTLPGMGVTSQAAKFGADPKRIYLAAYSAGGPMLAPYMLDAGDIAADYPLTVVNVPGAPHGFDNTSSQDPRAREAVRETLWYLQYHLDVKPDRL